VSKVVEEEWEVEFNADWKSWKPPDSGSESNGSIGESEKHRCTN